MKKILFSLVIILSVDICLAQDVVYDIGAPEFEIKSSQGYLIIDGLSGSSWVEMLISTAGIEYFWIVDMKLFKNSDTILMFHTPNTILKWDNEYDIDSMQIEEYKNNYMNRYCNFLSENISKEIDNLPNDVKYYYDIVLEYFSKLSINIKDKKKFKPCSCALIINIGGK